jgi:hypothetical protein
MVLFKKSRAPVLLSTSALRAMEQGAQSGGRLVDQGLLVAVEHFIAHRGDERARLPLAACAELH